MAPWLDPSIAANGLPVEENFRAWFGASQVLDRGGQPRKCWHGSTQVFEAFDFGWSEHFGMHFGSREQAAKFKAPRIPLLEVYLSIQNPIRLPDLGMWGFENLARHLDRRGLGILDSADYERAWNANDQNDELTQILLAKGHDGIVYENAVEGRGDSWIALRPQQIKSARNCGLFCTDNAAMDDLALSRSLSLASAERALSDLARLRPPPPLTPLPSKARP